MFPADYLSIVFQIIILFILLLLSALFSSTETAFTTLHPIDVKDMVLKKEKNAQLIEKLKEDTHLTIAAILLGNNLVNIFASALATLLTIHLFGDEIVAVTIGVLTFLILVFGEIAPKHYATRNARKLSIKMAKPIFILRTVLSPLLRVLLHVSKKTINSFDRVGGHERFAFDEKTISRLTEIGESEGYIEEDEKEFIQRLFKFSDKKVEEVMVPIDKMVYLHFYTKVGHAKNVAIRSGHSRIPVFKADINKFVGILYVKDLLKASDRKYIYTIMRHALFVDKDTLVDTQLRKFMKSHIHLALVLERNPGTSEKKVVGLVTLEDLIEELVGEIVDEHDVEELKEIEEKEMEERIQESYEASMRNGEK